MLFRTVVGVLAVPFLCSCVSYEEYRSLQDDLSRSERNNDDLITQYQRDRHHRLKSQKVNSSREEELLAEVAALKNQRRLDKKKEEPKAPGGKNFEKEDLPTGAKIESGGLSLGSGLLFQPGQASLKKHQLTSLDQVGNLLTGKYASYEVLIEGHTDNQPLRSTRQLFEYNISLGTARASNVFKYLSKRHSIPEKRFQLMSYGMSRPLNEQSANTEQGRRENRRVVFRLKRRIH